jgi:SAM-dependent methyltransferase
MLTGTDLPLSLVAVSSVRVATARTLRDLKFRASRWISPKAYWYLMGRLRPVPAVTSGFGSVAQCLASGSDVVALLDRFGAVGPDMVTLHIGSGLGRVEYHLSSRVQKCYGVDISSSMVRRARALVPFANVEFVVSDGASLARWPDGRFGLIYSFFVFQHLPRSQFHRYLTDGFAKLGAGGRLIFQILVDETGAPPDPPAGHPYGLRYYTRAEVETALRNAGFSEVARAGLSGEDDDPSATPAGDVVFCATKAVASSAGPT